MPQELWKYIKQFRFGLRLVFNFFIPTFKNLHSRCLLLVAFNCLLLAAAPPHLYSSLLQRLGNQIVRIVSKESTEGKTDVILVKLNLVYGFCYISCGKLQIFFLLDFLKCDLQISLTPFFIHSLGI